LRQKKRRFSGSAFNLPSALAFYRALRVYPSPVELIVLYEKSVPPPVFKVRRHLNWVPDLTDLSPQIVMDLMNLDVSSSESFGEGAEERTVETSTVSDEDDGDASPTRGSPPSVASSNEWDKLTDSGTQTPAS
jgi:import receptor subunit TOM20